VINVNLRAVFMAMKTQISAIKASGDTETRMMSTWMEQPGVRDMPPIPPSEPNVRASKVPLFLGDLTWPTIRELAG
jgi:hypothetical protein